jgi:putative two-component system response regulator
MSSPIPLSGSRTAILVVDDEAANIKLLRRILEAEGYRVLEATTGRLVPEIVAEYRPALVLMDVMMPSVDGLEACRRLKENAETRLLPVVLITASSDRGDRLRGIEAGADDFLTKPVDPHELRARVRSLVRLKRYTDDLDSAEAVILSLALTIEARDAYTEGHCQRLATYARALAERLGLREGDQAALYRGGFLHDVGKVGIPDAVLLKAGPLTSDEYAAMKQHTIIGDRLCGGLRLLRDVRPIVRHHHERLDGTGYPDGLRGDSIPLLAQILSVVDVYDALTTARPYKPALSVDEAIDELRNEVRRGWRRAELVEPFIALVASAPVSL